MKECPNDMTWKHFLPLIGFAITIVSACVTYVLGLRQAARGASDPESPAERGRDRRATRP